MIKSFRQMDKKNLSYTPSQWKSRYVEWRLDNLLSSGALRSGIRARDHVVQSFYWDSQMLVY